MVGIVIELLCVKVDRTLSFIAETVNGKKPDKRKERKVKSQIDENSF